jgi:hypothetical protein
MAEDQIFDLAFSYQKISAQIIYMLKSVKKCYRYICKLFSDRFDNVYTVNQKQLQQENLHYCIMHDGDFMKKEDPQPMCMKRPPS